MSAFLKIVLVLIGCLYLLFVAILYLFQRNMMYLPPRNVDIASLQQFEAQKVTTADGIELTGYYLPPASPEAPVLVMFHGNASHPAWNAGKLALLRERLGIGAILVEYRGYGGNPGKPTQAGLVADGKAWADWWKAREESLAHPLVYYGESLGTGVAIQLAAISPPDALILETPYDSILNVARHHYRFVPGMGRILSDQYLSDALIGELSMPKLFLMAGRDTIVPKTSSDRLYELAAPPKARADFPQAGHVDIFSQGGDAAVLEFLLKILERGKGAASA